MEQKNKTANNMRSLFTFLIVLVYIFVAKYLGLKVLLIFSIAAIAGSWFAKWYLKKAFANKILIKCIIWSNIVTWLIPIIGIATGTAAIELSSYSPEDKRKYRIIGIVSLVASILNATIATMIVY